MNSYSIALAHELKDEGIKVIVATPGYTSTKINHYASGARPVKEGAESLVPWVLLDKDGPTGKFFNRDGKEFPW
jgi:short-subunit dehydrogenase